MDKIQKIQNILKLRKLLFLLCSEVLIKLNSNFQPTCWSKF